MYITIATLRAAGLSEAQIVKVVDFAEKERLANRREVNRNNQRKHRARKHVTADGADRCDTPIYKDTSLLPSLEKKRKKGRKIDMPADWKPTVSSEDEGEFERFKRYCKANDKTYVDWDAAWGNWRTSPYRGGQNGTNRQKGDRSHSISATFDDIFAKLQGSDGASVVPFEANPRMLQNRRRE
jgi:hypothetical protein